MVPSERPRVLARLGVVLAMLLLAWPAIGTAREPTANFKAEPRLGEAPLVVQFTNTSSPGEGALTFHWDFGDGQTSTEANPTHTYHVPRQRSYEATLTVTDSLNQTDSKSDFITVDGPTLVAALLPVSRSVVVGNPATAFVTVINAGAITAPGVSIKLDPSAGPGGGPLPAQFMFQTTDASTNLLTGAPNIPVNIPAGQSQSFLVAVTPTEGLPPTDVRFDIAGTNSTRNARKVTGLNTLLLSASTSATPDIVALAVTPDGNGILTLAGSPASGAFSVATANVGALGDITASADTGAAILPIDLSICRTDPATGACAADASPSVTMPIDPGATLTFAVFATTHGAVPFDPTVNRIFVRFRDAGGVTRGATSVAVKAP